MKMLKLLMTAIVLAVPSIAAAEEKVVLCFGDKSSAIDFMTAEGFNPTDETYFINGKSVFLYIDIGTDTYAVTMTNNLGLECFATVGSGIADAKTQLGGI